MLCPLVQHSAWEAKETLSVAVRSSVVKAQEAAEEAARRSPSETPLADFAGDSDTEESASEACDTAAGSQCQDPASAPPRGRRGAADDDLITDMSRVPKNDGTGSSRFSRDVAEKDVALILRLRDEVLDGNPTPDVLPLEAQKQVHKRLFEAWAQDPANAEAMSRIEKECRGGKAGIMRAKASRHRSFCRERYGGKDWAHLFIAFGRVDDEIMEAFNWAVERMKEQRKALKGDGAALAPSSRGRGIQHRKSDAKKLREKGKSLDKLIESERVAYRHRRSTMTWPQWEKLQAKADGVWRRHQKLVDEMGVDYRGRDGNWVVQARPGVVGLTIQRWLDRRGRPT